MPFSISLPCSIIRSFPVACRLSSPVLESFRACCRRGRTGTIWPAAPLSSRVASPQTSLRYRGIAVVYGCPIKSLKWRIAAALGALLSTVLMTMPNAARGAGFFVFFFGGNRRRPASIPMPSRRHRSGGSRHSRRREASSSAKAAKPSAVPWPFACDCATASIFRSSA